MEYFGVKDQWFFEKMDKWQKKNDKSLICQLGTNT
jgi:hypothetical protein